MTLRIKEICREKKMTLAEVASRIKYTDKGGEHVGISPVSLSQSLNGNPTLGRLTEVARILGVEVTELFERPKRNTIYGCLYVNGTPTIVSNRRDIEKLLKRLDGAE